MNIIDLFAGCGGFSQGFKNAGYTTVEACEINEDIAKTFEYNHKANVFIGDIKDFHLEKYKGKIEGIIGGPPCQGFSMSGNRNRKNSNFLSDSRNFLFKEYLRILKEVEPNFFVMENVSGMITLDSGNIFKEIMHELSKLKVNNNKYFISYKILNAGDYGVPQNRKRLIILGSLKNIDIKNMRISEKEYFVWDAISDLENQKFGHNIKKEYKAKKDLAVVLSDSKKIFNHIPTKHSQIVMNRILQIKEGEKLIDTKIKSVHSGAYARMMKSEKSMTITTRFDTPSAGRYIHPTQNRTITPREGARLQTFSDSYEFIGTKTNIYKMIGNAVPVKLAESIANFIKNS